MLTPGLFVDSVPERVLSPGVDFPTVSGAVRPTAELQAHLQTLNALLSDLDRPIADPAETWSTIMALVQGYDRDHLPGSHAR